MTDKSDSLRIADLREVKNVKESAEAAILDAIFGPASTAIAEVEWMRRGGDPRRRRETNVDIVGPTLGPTPSTRGGPQWESSPLTNKQVSAIQMLIDHAAAAAGTFTPAGQIMHHSPSMRPSNLLPAIYDLLIPQAHGVSDTKLQRTAESRETAGSRETGLSIPEMIEAIKDWLSSYREMEPTTDQSPRIRVEGIPEDFDDARWRGREDARAAEWEEPPSEPADDTAGHLPPVEELQSVEEGYDPFRLEKK